MKKKFVRANEVPYLTKVLKKTIIKDLNSKVNISKIKIITTWTFIKSKKTFAVKERKKYSKIDTHKITDNKTFWKKTTPISSKAPSLSIITLTESKAIISDDQKVAETLSKFFVKTVDKLDIKEFKNISNIDGLSNPVEIATKKYKNHPSIIVIT